MRSLHSLYLWWWPSRKIPCRQSLPAVRSGIASARQIFALRVTRRSYNAALIRAAAARRGTGLPRNSVPFEQLDRDEKRIHVDVKDRCGGRESVLFRRAVDRSKSCQLRHPPSLRPIRDGANVRGSLRSDDARECRARSLVTPTRVHSGAVEERLHGEAGCPWPSSSTARMPPGIEICSADCVTSVGVGVRGLLHAAVQRRLPGSWSRTSRWSVGPSRRPMYGGLLAIRSNGACSVND